MSVAPGTMYTPADNEVSGVDGQSWARQKAVDKRTDSCVVSVDRSGTRSWMYTVEARCEWRGWGAVCKGETHKTRSLLPGTYQTVAKRRRKVCDDSRADLNRAADLCLVRVRDSRLGILALFPVLLAGATDAAASTSSGREGSSRGGSSLQTDVLLAQAGCYNCVLPAAACSPFDRAPILACGVVLVE